jgi:hypothetical protein
MTDTAVDVSEDQSIWHYRQFAQFVAILQKHELWFSRLDCLPDPFEGRSVGYQGDFRKLHDDHRRKGCVSCWTIDDEESELMWYAFAPGFGVAIRCTKAALKASFKLPGADMIEVNSVTYEPDWSQGTPDFAFVKRRGFEREQELRAFLPYKYEYDEGGRIIEPTYCGRAVPVDLSSLMAEVWVAPNSPDWFEGVVRRELKQYGCDGTPVKRRS